MNRFFKEYQSKPVVRKAYEVKEGDCISSIDECTSVLLGVTEGFKHYAPVLVGDFIVYLNDNDIYHCPREVFLERNVLPEQEV
jgi:hypothetical protein